MFKKGEKWSLAGQTYSRISSIMEEVLKLTQFTFNSLLILQLGADYIEDAATFYGEAGDCYEKTEPKKAIENLQKAIYIYTEKDMFNDVAHRQLKVAKLLESENDRPSALLHYEIAGEFFKRFISGEVPWYDQDMVKHSKKLLSECVKKTAEYAVQQGFYEKAIQIYEQVRIKTHLTYY